MRPLTLVAHRQVSNTEKKCAFKYSLVINIPCDVIADVVDVNMKTRPLTSASSYARICGTRKVAAE